MDLLINQLKNAIRALLDAKGVRARVLDKVNAQGEVVIGVIIEKPSGARAVLTNSASRETSVGEGEIG